MNIAQNEIEALSLPADARTSLAHRLLLSLEEISESDFDRLWGEESERRNAEADAGLAQAVPGDEFARKARGFATVTYSFLPDAEAEYLEAMQFFEDPCVGLGAALIIDGKPDARLGRCAGHQLR